MATVEQVEVKNWHDLHLRLDDYFTHYDGYIFRGQADAKWKLESSLTRSIHRVYPDATASQIRSLTASHLYRFRRNIRGRCDLDLGKVDDERLWALGQHFGLYTPLLDWSRSPYVALFFSLYGPCESGLRSLWALFESDIDEFWPPTVRSSEKIKIIHPLGHENQRLVSQNGLFLSVPVGKSADDMILKCKDLDYVTLYRFTFPDAIRNDILAALNNMNINHASLFQDLSGSSLFANTQLEIDPHLESGKTRGFVGDEF
jgi:hypothetical protein